jgi:hypothetical protein
MGQRLSSFLPRKGILRGESWPGILKGSGGVCQVVGCKRLASWWSSPLTFLVVFLFPLFLILFWVKLGED